jgi:hypothetical protein
MTESQYVLDILKEHPVDLLEFADWYYTESYHQLHMHLQLFRHFIEKLKFAVQAKIIDPLISQSKKKLVKQYVVQM